MKLVIGVDPGMSGGVCLLAPPGSVFGKDGNGVVSLERLPTRATPNGNLIDGVELWRRFSSYCAIVRAVCDEDLDLYPVVERVWAMSGEGVKSVFTFGRSTGTVIGVLEALTGKPVHEVAPVTWQPVVLGARGKNKKESKARTLAWAKAAYPGQELLATPRSKVPHGGMVDALAVATYGLKAL